jgi:hypothetical protein
MMAANSHFLILAVPEERHPRNVGRKHALNLTFELFVPLADHPSKSDRSACNEVSIAVIFAPKLECMVEGMTK